MSVDADTGPGLLSWALGALGAIGTGLGSFALTRSVSHGEKIRAIEATCVARAAANEDMKARMDRIEDKQDRMNEKLDRLLER